MLVAIAYLPNAPNTAIADYAPGGGGGGARAEGGGGGKSPGGGGGADPEGGGGGGAEVAEPLAYCWIMADKPGGALSPGGAA